MGPDFLVSGPHESPKRLTSSVIIALLNQTPALCSHGSQLRDFMHVADVAAGLVALLDSQVQGTVNIATGQPVSIKQLIFTVAEFTGRTDLIQLGAVPTAANEPALVVADVKRLMREVGFSPKYDLKTGLSQTVEWWKTELERNKLA